MKTSEIKALSENAHILSERLAIHGRKMEAAEISRLATALEIMLAREAEVRSAAWEASLHSDPQPYLELPGKILAILDPKENEHGRD